MGTVNFGRTQLKQRVEPKVDGPGSKWTLWGVKVDGPKDLKWTVLAQSGWSKMTKAEGPEMRKWTILEG